MPPVTSEPPVWLTPEQSEAWLAVIYGIRALLRGLDDQLQRDADMTHAAYAVLVRLSNASDHTMPMGELAAETRYSPSALSHLIRRLEERGWVKRWLDANDKRRMFAMMTAEGVAALRDAAPGHVAFVRDVVFSNLNEREVRLLTKTFRAMSGRLAEIASAVD